MHPVIEAIVRCKDSNIRPDIFRQWQRTLREEIAPALDRLACLEGHGVEGPSLTVEQLESMASMDEKPKRGKA